MRRKLRFYCCHYCKKPFPMEQFVELNHSNCVCKCCDTFGDRLIPKQYDQIQGINYLRRVLEILK